MDAHGDSDAEPADIPGRWSADRSEPGPMAGTGRPSWGTALPPPPRENPKVSTPGTRPEIVYLDPQAARPVSQYSPEGEIRMMGDLAAGLIGRRRMSRPMAYALVAVVLLPILISVIAVLSNWWS